VQRGDIVVFDDPGDWLGPNEGAERANPVQEALEMFGLFPTGGHLVKRVIGVGGDHVRCCDREGRIVVNGVALEESYLPEGVAPSASDFDVEVEPGKLWVMGDNRPASSDSRAHQGSDGGAIDVDDVVGKVWAVVWPASRVELVERPAVFDNQALDREPAQ